MCIEYLIKEAKSGNMPVVDKHIWLVRGIDIKNSLEKINNGVPDSLESKTNYSLYHSVKNESLYLNTKNKFFEEVDTAGLSWFLDEAGDKYE